MRVKAFLDTSVLVAVFYGEHEYHDASLGLFVQQNKSTACTAAHCLAEFYSVVTGMPGKNRASPDEALLFLGDVRERLTIVALDENEYFKALEDAAAANIFGGTSYDAVIAQCALKANAKRYTRGMSSTSIASGRPLHPASELRETGLEILCARGGSKPRARSRSCLFDRSRLSRTRPG